MIINKLQFGDILMCEGKRSLANAIKIATASQFSHSANYFELYFTPDGKPYPFIFDAQKKGAYIKTLDQWEQKYAYEYLILRNPNPIDREVYSQRLLSLNGTPYDFINLIFRKPRQIITKEWKDKPNELERLICNGVTAYLHGLPNPDSYTPQMLWDVLITLGYRLINY